MMKCEICHKAEATTVLTCTKDGVERELYVCQACADKNRETKTSRAQKPSSPPQVKRVIGPNETPPPFVEEFVKATLGFMKEFAENEENEKRVCPVCKSKWDAIKETGRLGCPACWKTFARHLRAEFFSAQYGPAHLGKAPAIGKARSSKDTRAILERDLKNAIACEDFHLAANLKKKLDALDKGGNT